MVRVGLYENAPKIYPDAGGRPDGLFVDLLEQMAVDEGWQLHWVHCVWAECLAGLEDGELDLMPDVAFSAERAKLFDFHRVSVASSWSQVYTRPDTTAYTVADLAGKKVAVLEGGIQRSFFADRMASGGYQYQEVPVTSLDEGYAAVRDGSADAVITDSSSLPETPRASGWLRPRSCSVFPPCS